MFVVRAYRKISDKGETQIMPRLRYTCLQKEEAYALVDLVLLAYPNSSVLISKEGED